MSFSHIFVRFARQPFVATTVSLLACAALQAAPVDDWIAKGDALSVKLQAAEALAAYQAAEKLEPKNASIHVRIARQYRHLMVDAKSTKEKLKLGGLALEHGKRAVALDPKDSDAQLSPAISHGKLLPLYGSREQVEASRGIKESADKAIELNPRNDLAWHILGRWHRNIADISAIKRALAAIVYGKLPTGTHEDAVRCFQKAIEINPNRLMHHIELGRTYALMGRKEEARRSIEKGLAMPDEEKDDPETKQHGRETLEKLR